MKTILPMPSFPRQIVALSLIRGVPASFFVIERAKPLGTLKGWLAAEAEKRGRKPILGGTPCL